MGVAEVSMTEPWTFEQALRASEDGSRRQRQAEQWIIDAARDFAEKERAYRMSLAQAMTRLKAEGVAWTVTGDLGRGDRHVADLKHARDIAEGVKEAASHAAWRASKDRDHVGELLRWSMRRDLAEDPEPERMQTFGARAA